MTRLELDDAEVRHLVAKAEALASVRHSDHPEADEARRRLRAHGLADEEIERQLATLASNTAGTPAVLTSYSLLHSLQYLDAIDDASSPREPDAEALIAIFRCAEIVLGALALLAERMTRNLERGDVGRVVANARWRAGLVQLLYRLSGLVAELGASAADGDRLEIASSPAYARWRESTDELRRRLLELWPEPAEAIFGEELDEPRRYVYFHEFVDTGDERTWRARLASVRLSGVRVEPGESAPEFFRRVVGSDEIEAMLGALETQAETDLLPFRVVHQISETIAHHVNRRLCASIAGILGGDEAALHRSLAAVVAGNRLLSAVDDSVHLLMRALTPRAYRAVRPNLGMVRGTSSVVLRKVLFNSTYPLLLRALRLRLAGGSRTAAEDDAEVERRARELLAAGDVEARALAGLVRAAVVLHQHVRTWRDNHLQLPKTHLGISPVAERPTVSLSGSESAVAVAHELRHAHAADPILPFHRACFGADPSPVHDLLTPGSFDEQMAHRTASAVFDVYADVQQRFYDRRRRA